MTVALVLATERLLRDVRAVQIPQLAACRDTALQRQLQTDIKAELARLRANLEELRELVEDLPKAKDRLAGEAQHVELSQQLLSVTRLYREAVLSSKRAIDSSAYAFARTSLLGTTSTARRRVETSAPANADDALMAATMDVTDGLRRTMELMQQELDRSMLSTEILESSTATMQLTTDQYSTFTTLLSTSKALITSLERADYLDKLLLLAALLFFFLCCAFIFKRRVVDKGIKVATALGSIASRGSSGGGRGATEEMREAMRDERRAVEHVYRASVAVVSSVASLATSSLAAFASRAQATAAAAMDSPPVKRGKKMGRVTREKRPRMDDLPTKVRETVQEPRETIRPVVEAREDYEEAVARNASSLHSSETVSNTATASIDSADPASAPSDDLPLPTPSEPPASIPSPEVTPLVPPPVAEEIPVPDIPSEELPTIATPSPSLLSVVEPTPEPSLLSTTITSEDESALPSKATEEVHARASPELETVALPPAMVELVVEPVELEDVQLQKEAPSVPDLSMFEQAMPAVVQEREKNPKKRAFEGKPPEEFVPLFEADEDVERDEVYDAELEDATYLAGEEMEDFLDEEVEDDGLFDDEREAVPLSVAANSKTVVATPSSTPSPYPAPPAVELEVLAGEELDPEFFDAQDDIYYEEQETQGGYDAEQGRIRDEL